MSEALSTLGSNRLTCPQVKSTNVPICPSAPRGVVEGQMGCKVMVSSCRVCAWMPRALYVRVRPCGHTAHRGQPPAGRRFASVLPLIPRSNSAFRDEEVTDIRYTSVVVNSEAFVSAFSKNADLDLKPAAQTTRLLRGDELFYSWERPVSSVGAHGTRTVRAMPSAPPRAMPSAPAPRHALF